MQAGEITLSSILVVEDDIHAQARLSRLLREVAGVDVCIGIADDVCSARELVANGARHDLALVDVQLPDGNGVDFIGWLRRQRPSLPAVIVSSWAEEGTILQALRSGAIGYLLKNAEDIELSMHLRSLQRGGAAIDPVIARRLLELMPHAPVAPSAAEHAAQKSIQQMETQLSARETEILQLVARGLGNREIADVIGLSKLTIESHTRNIYRKLEVGSRTEAVFEATALGLLH